MVWARRTRISLLIMLLLLAATLSWLASHPSLYAGQVGRLLTTNLLHEAGATFSCRDLEGNPLSRMVFRDVTVTREGDDGSFLYVTADSLVVGYDLRAMWSRRTELQEFVTGGVDILLRLGDSTKDDDQRSAGSLPPQLRVDHLALLDIDITITSADGEPVHEFRELTIELSAAPGGDGLDAVLTRAEVHWVNQDVRLRRALGRVRLAPPRYEFSSMQLETDSIKARVDGIVIADEGLDSLRIEGHVDQFVLNELLLLMGKEADGPYLAISGDGIITKSGDILRIEGSGAGLLEDAPLAVDNFVGVLRDDVLRFEQVSGQYRSARGEATGELRIHPDPPLLLLDARLRGADASDPWADGEDMGWPISDLAGLAHLELSLGDSVGLQLKLSELTGRAATLPLDSAELTCSWSEAQGFELREARVLSQGATITAWGTISPSGQVALRVGAEIDSLAPWAREVELPIAGESASMTGLLSGSLDSLQLSASGTVVEVRALEVTVADAVIDLRVPRLVRSPGDVDLELFSPRMRVLDHPTGSVGLIMSRREPFIEIGQLVIDRADSDLVMRGRVEELVNGRFAINLDTLGTSWGEDQWHLVEGERMVVGEGYFQAEDLAFASDVGRIAVDGGVSPPGLLDVQIDVRQGDLNLLDRLDLVADIQGGLNGQFRFSGTLDSTSFQVDATVDTLKLPGQQIDSARIVAGAEGGHLTIDSFELDSARGGGAIEGHLVFERPDWLRAAVRGYVGMDEIWRGASVQLRVRPRGLDVAQLGGDAAAAGSMGYLTADLEISGATLRPRASGRVRLEDYPAPPFHFPAFEALINLDEDGVTIEEGLLDLGGPMASVRAQLPLIISLADSTSFLPDRGMDLELRTPENMDLSGLPSVWPDLRRTEGTGSIEFIATGNPHAPELSGKVQIRDGLVQLVGWSEWLRELKLDGSFVGQELKLERVEAREGAKGKITGSGNVAFAGLLPDDVALDFDVHRVLISSVPGLKAIATGDNLKLRLERTGPDQPRAPTISGTVTVDKARYTGSFESDPSGEAALGPNVAPPWMARVRINMRDQVQISNSFTELRVGGDMDFTRDAQGLRLRGTTTIPSGRISILGTNFKITEGELDFSRRPVEPEVNITAITEVPIYDSVGNTGRTLEEITLNMTGTFASPELNFDSKSGYDDTSIMRLIAGLQPASSTSSNAMGTLGMRAGFSVLESALSQEMTGVDTLEIETTESGVDEVGSTRIAFGKYLTESVYLRYAQGFTAGERDILLEYQMSQRTLISGEIKSRIDEAGPEDEFNVDFKWRFRY